MMLTKISCGTVGMKLCDFFLNDVTMFFFLIDVSMIFF